LNLQNDMENKLRKEGYKFTKQRKSILEVFLRERKSLLSLQQIYEKVKEKYPTVDFSTIYRNIELLVNLDIIHKIYTGKPYGSYKLKELNKHHHHIICIDCGKAEVIEFCPLGLLESQLKKKNFLPMEHNFEVFGYCAECKVKKGELL
jgi:Fe2+ or Zn2+ uptake regulation protein